MKLDLSYAFLIMSQSYRQLNQPWVFTMDISNLLSATLDN